MNSRMYSIPNNLLAYICSEEQLRKKASVLFGIRFDDKKYSELKTQLKIIKENKDLVCKFLLEKRNQIDAHFS